MLGEGWLFLKVDQISSLPLCCTGGDGGLATGLMNCGVWREGAEGLAWMESGWFPFKSAP